MKYFLILFTTIFIVGCAHQENVVVPAQNRSENNFSPAPLAPTPEISDETENLAVSVADPADTGSGELEKIRSIGNNFTSCSKSIDSFSDKSWFQDFRQSLDDARLKILPGDNIDVCFSPNLDKVILNVPFVISSAKPVLLCANGDGQKKPCEDTLNIFSYDITSKMLSQAIRDPKTIIYSAPEGSDPSKLSLKDSQTILHVWNDYYGGFEDADIAIALLNGFEKEEGNFIILSSGYGDAGCAWSSVWEYDYLANIIRLKSQKSHCEGM